VDLVSVLERVPGLTTTHLLQGLGGLGQSAKKGAKDSNLPATEPEAGFVSVLERC
jgi:hypothetical protein